jgi:hypothetical protein
VSSLEAWSIHRASVGPFSHAVPDSPNTGYKVSCNSGNTGGTFSTCTDNTCGTCNVNTPFTNEQVRGGGDSCGRAAHFPC